jgi:hypothetical protein
MGTGLRLRQRSESSDSDPCEKRTPHSHARVTRGRGHARSARSGTVRPSRTHIGRITRSGTGTGTGTCVGDCSGDCSVCGFRSWRGRAVGLMPEDTSCFGREDGAGVIQRTAERSGVEWGWKRERIGDGDCDCGVESGVMSPYRPRG